MAALRVQVQAGCLHSKCKCRVSAAPWPALRVQVQDNCKSCKCKCKTARARKMGRRDSFDHITSHKCTAPYEKKSYQYGLRDHQHQSRSLLPPKGVQHAPRNEPRRGPALGCALDAARPPPFPGHRGHQWGALACAHPCLRRIYWPKRWPGRLNTTPPLDGSRSPLLAASCAPCQPGLLCDRRRV